MTGRWVRGVLGWLLLRQRTSVLPQCGRILHWADDQFDRSG